jgi:hypothetical protein
MNANIYEAIYIHAVYTFTESDIEKIFYENTAKFHSKTLLLTHMWNLNIGEGKVNVSQEFN